MSADAVASYPHGDSLWMICCCFKGKYGTIGSGEMANAASPGKMNGGVHMVGDFCLLPSIISNLYPRRVETMAETPNNQVAVPVTDLTINFKDSTLVVEPTAAIDGFEKDSYDSAVLTTTLELNNPTERLVEIPLPFPTESYTAEIAVISKGADEYSDRVRQVTKVKGDLSRFIPYLQRMGTPPEILGNDKKLKELLRGFRVGLVNIPAGNVAIRIQATQVVESDSSDPSHKTFKFRTYAPLPSFLVGGGGKMRLTAIYKQVDRYPRTVTPLQSNPLGDNVGLPEPQITNLPGETIYHWDWQNDPVIDWTIVYQ